MARYARIVSGLVVEISALPDGLTPSDCYAATVAEAFVACPDPNVGQSWAYDGKVFSPPVAPTFPPEQITQVNFLGFLALFTATEQAAIVNSTDPRIKLFCLMAAGASIVDLADLRTVAGTQELETLGLIGKGRAKQVLAGQAPPTS